MDMLLLELWTSYQNLDDRNRLVVQIQISAPCKHSKLQSIGYEVVMHNGSSILNTKIFHDHLSNGLATRTLEDSSLLTYNALQISK